MIWVGPAPRPKPLRPPWLVAGARGFLAAYLAAEADAQAKARSVDGTWERLIAREVAEDAALYMAPLGR